MKTLASIIAISALAVACGAQAPGSPDGGTAEALGTTEQAATTPVQCADGPAPALPSGNQRYSCQLTWTNCPAGFAPPIGSVDNSGSIFLGPPYWVPDTLAPSCAWDATSGGAEIYWLNGWTYYQYLYPSFVPGLPYPCVQTWSNFTTCHQVCFPHQGCYAVCP